MTQAQDTQERWIDKVHKLLEKANDPACTPEEAEAFSAKAMELMTLHAIDEQMLAAAAGRTVDELGDITLTFSGIFQQATMNLGFVVADHFNCRAFYVDHPRPTTRRNPDGSVTKIPRHIDVRVFGFRSDLTQVELLATSLEIQSMRALAEWRKTCSPDLFKLSSSEQFKQRRGFLFAFASGVREKLVVARQAGQQEAAKLEAERSHVTQEAANTSVALVLRSRKAQVDDWFDTTFGRGLRASRSRYSGGGRDASEAGHAAGRRADTGQPGVRGSRGALGRG